MARMFPLKCVILTKKTTYACYSPWCFNLKKAPDSLTTSRQSIKQEGIYTARKRIMYNLGWALSYKKK